MTPMRFPSSFFFSPGFIHATIVYGEVCFKYLQCEKEEGTHISKNFEGLQPTPLT